MILYRIWFTRVIHDSVDITAPGPEEAKEFFWQYARRNLRDGDVTEITVTEKGDQQ